MIGEIGILSSFNEWVAKQEVPVIVVAGNHDLSLENNKHTGKAILNKAIYLEDDGVEVNGLKIYGSPFSPKLPAWAFGYEKDHADLIWEGVPEDTEVLITHGPPWEILDKTLSRKRGVGCPSLWKRVKEVKPILHVFGHIHESRGVKKTKDTCYVNASICNFPNYEDLRNPIVVDVPR